MHACFEPPRGNTVEKHHRDDVERKRLSVLVRRNGGRAAGTRRKIRSEGEHRTEAECLKKQITHRGTGFQYAPEPSGHQLEHVPSDFAADGEPGQEILFHIDQHQRIRREKNKNRLPATQALQQCADHGCDQRHNHQNDADKGKHLGGFASGIIIAHHCADGDYSRARTECLHDAQVEELFGTRSKYDGGNGRAVGSQSVQRDGFAPL